MRIASRFCRLALLLATLLLPPCLYAQPADPAGPSTFPSPGVRLRGSQFHYDYGLTFLDFDHDGKLDLLMPNSGMIGASAYLNEGTPEDPVFTHDVSYPLNITETVPQTIEHAQAWCVTDLNSDGLWDIIWHDGQLRLCINTGTPHGPNHWNLWKSAAFFPGSERMIAENARISTGPESMFWNKGIFPRQVITIAAADWDGDGLTDLIICRTKDEAPGVRPTGGHQTWTTWGRVLINKPTEPVPPADSPSFLAPLKEAPARGLYFYRNVGSKSEPAFDQGVEILDSQGQAIAAPNPEVVDVDGDGVLDILSSETAYHSNALRVDWPTVPHVQFFRRPGKGALAQLEPGKPLVDDQGQPIAAGPTARLCDFRQTGQRDLFVQDASFQGTIRWYRNTKTTGMPAFAAPVILRGQDFLRSDFMAQPVIVDWFAPGSRDLILHGSIDAHCKWSLRRTALYRNTAKAGAAPSYQFVGHFTFRGDPAVVPVSTEERPYDVYGSSVAFFPEPSRGDRRMMMSVGGRLYLASGLASDGLTYQELTPLNLPAENNRVRGWQEISVDVPDPVRFIRIGNDPNGMGNLRDSMLHMLQFEAHAGGKNVATLEAGVQIKKTNSSDSIYYRVQNPQALFTPGNKLDPAKPSFTTWGYYVGPAVITLPQPVRLEKIRFLLADREPSWYSHLLPFYWQGKLYRQSGEAGEPWFQYKLEVSADEKNWTLVKNAMSTEILYSHPQLLDFDSDGKVDLLLGVTSGNGIFPSTKSYRFYPNRGSNESPRFDHYQSFCDDKGKPLAVQADWFMTYGAQCGFDLRDFDSDGKLDLIIEGPGKAQTIWYRNVSSPEQPGFRFQNAAILGGAQPIRYNSRYRYFDLADADGDGIADLINSDGSQLAFFKGVAFSAPLPVSDLIVAATASGALRAAWTRPAQSASYDLRWSPGRRLTELDWDSLPGLKGAYSAAPGALEEVDLPKLPPGSEVLLAVKSLASEAQVSGVSNIAAAAAPPLRRLVISPGLALPGAAADQPYDGVDVAVLNATEPEKPQDASQMLEVRAQTDAKNLQRVLLVRFRNLPALGKLERAQLILSSDPKFEHESMMQALNGIAISCSAIAVDWDPAQATSANSRPGQPWPANLLDAGGAFQSFALPRWTIEPRHQLDWDVTSALKQAQRERKTQVSFLIRVDYTGKYIGGAGYRFCPPQWKAPQQRPQLSLWLKD